MTLRGLSRVGSVGLMAYALLFLGSGFLAEMGPPPSTGAELVSWMVAHTWALGSQSEILFFALMCLIPAVPALYDHLKASSPASAT